MKKLIGSLSPDFAVEILGKYGFFRDDYLGMLLLEHRQPGEEEEEEQRESLQELVHHLQTQIENWQKQESALFVTRPFVVAQLRKVLGHAAYMQEIRSRETLRQVDRHIERKAASVMRTVTTAGGAGRQLSLHFYSEKRHVYEREVEKRLIERDVPQEGVRELLRTLQESRNIHRIQRELRQQGVADVHVEQIVQTLLHPQVLLRRETAVQRLLQERTLQVDHREVEKRLMEKGIPQEGVRKVLHSQVLQRQAGTTQHLLQTLLNSQLVQGHGTTTQQFLQTILNSQMVQGPGTTTQYLLRTILNSQVVQGQGTTTKQLLRTILNSQVVQGQGTTTKQLLQTILNSQVVQGQGTTTQQLLQTILNSQLVQGQGTTTQQILRIILNSQVVQGQGTTTQQLLQTILNSQVVQGQGTTTHQFLQTFLNSQVVQGQGTTTQQLLQTILNSQVVQGQGTTTQQFLQTFLNSRMVQGKGTTTQHLLQTFLNPHMLQSQGTTQQLLQTLLYPQVVQRQATTTQRLLQASLPLQVLQIQGTSIEQVQVQHEQEKHLLPLERTLLQEHELRFNHREVEKRLLDQDIPQERIQDLLQTLHETRNIHQIERHLHHQGVSAVHVEQIVQTLLHPQVLQTREVVRQVERALLQERELRFNHREVEKRLLDQDIPQERIQHLLQTLHETRNIHQIERFLHQQGASTVHVEQIVQTLLHPQVLRKQHTTTQQLAQFLDSQANHTQEQHLLPRELPFNHREVEQRLLEQGIPQERIRHLIQTLHESRNIHQIERHLYQQGASAVHVEQIMQTLLHPHVLQKQQQVTRIERTLLQERELRFNHRAVEKLLLDQDIPQERIQHLLQTLHESRNIHQIERHLHRQGVPPAHAERILQTLLHPQALLKQGRQGQQGQQADPQPHAPTGLHHRAAVSPIDVREVFRQGAPQLRQEVQRLHENSTFHLIEKQLQTLGVQSHHVQQVFQTLLHPQVLKVEGTQSQPIQLIVQTMLHPQVLLNLEESLFQHSLLRFDHRDMDKQLLDQGLPSHLLQQVMQTLEHPSPEQPEPGLRFEHREVEKRLLEQQIPLEQIQQVLPALTQRSTFRQIEKYLTERGLPQQTVQQVMYTLLHPRVLRSNADRTLMTRMLRWTTERTTDRTTRSDNRLRFDHREVEKRLLAQSVPTPLVQRVLQTLHETSTFGQIQRRLGQRGLSTHQIQQVMQTLVHPRVYQNSQADRNLLQTALLRFDHRVEPEAEHTTNQPNGSPAEAMQIHRDGSYGGQAPIEFYRPKPVDPPPPPPAPAAPPAPPVRTEQKVRLENLEPDELERLTDRIYREIEKRNRLERSLLGL